DLAGGAGLGGARAGGGGHAGARGGGVVLREGVRRVEVLRGRGGRRRSAPHDRVRQGADALDADVDRGAGGDGADPGRGAGEHQVPGQQGDDAGDLGHQVGDGAEHVRGGDVLGGLAVHGAGDREGGRRSEERRVGAGGGRGARG